MTNYRSLNHSKWACQYHVVFIPKYRKKAIYGSLRRHLGGVLRELARQRESEVEEGHLLADHVHMLVSIPPKYSVAQVIGYMKGKSAIHIAESLPGGRAALSGSTSGLGATSCLRWVGTSERFARISGRRNRKTVGKSNFDWMRTATRRVAQVAAQWPRPAALSGSQLKPPALPGDTYCSERLKRKGLLRALGNLGIDAEEVPACRGLGEVRAPVGGLCFGERALCGGAHQRPVAFDQRKV